MTHLASVTDMRTACGLFVRAGVAITIRRNRVNCPACESRMAHVSRTPVESLAFAARRRGNSWS